MAWRAPQLIVNRFLTFTAHEAGAMVWWESVPRRKKLTAATFCLTMASIGDP
jgi:hypothetical protein